MNLDSPDLLTERIPAQAVIEELLAARRKDAPRSTLGRIFGVSPLSPESLPWYKGALGEIAVGRILERLGPDWLVLHAVPVGIAKSDIDHVVIGPAGVFTLNTKNHSGQPVWVAGRTLMVAGRRTGHVHNAEYEAARAAKLLSEAAGAAVEVTGVVVIVEPKSLTIKARPDRVAVVTERQLLGWLNRSRPGLGPEEVARISAVAVQAGTWHRNPRRPRNADEVLQNFMTLRRLVNQARRRRAAWLLGVPAVGLLALAGGGPLGQSILRGLSGQ
jgi:hypothetical protein